MSLKLVIQNCEVRVQQVCQRVVIGQDLLKEQDRLVSDGRLELSILICGKQYGIRFDVPAQLARPQPLLDKMLRKLKRFWIFEHADYLLVQREFVLQLAGRGQVEQDCIRHAAPYEIRQSCSEFIIAQEPRSGIRVWFHHAEDEMRRNQNTLQGIQY